MKNATTHAALMVAGLFAVATAAAQTTQPARTLMRYPTIHADTIVFVAHGNLWAVGKTGGVARRLTADPGQDIMPRFSPDGKWIAYTASTQGNTDVYVIPAGGGEARRLTFHSDIVARAPERWGPNNMVLTWTPDSRNVVYLARDRAFDSWFNLAFEVPVAGGLPVALPLDQAGLMSFGPDGHSIAYNRIFRNFRTWKRYDGGLAQDIFVYDFASKKLSRVTDWKGTSTSPMWAGRRIYYLSDRDAQRRANIWVHDLDGGAGPDRELTHFTDYDIDFPSIGDGTIVFQQGGALYALDIASEKVQLLDVTVPDDGTRTQPRMVHADKQLRMTDSAEQTDFALSPNGKRALLVGRGDLFSVPAEHGATRNLTATSNADEDHPAWSPDGSTIAYTTDASGLQQIAIRPAAGGAEKQLTHFANGFFYTPVFSPDGKSLAVSDANHRLWIVGTAGGAPKLVATNQYSEIHDQTWSPDSRYLVFSQSRPTHLDMIWLYDNNTGQSTQLSDAMEDDSSPVFTPDGKYLVFLSNRHENPTMSSSEENVATLKTAGIYIAPLSQDAPSPLAPRSDEGAFEVPKKDGEGHDYKPGNSKPVHVEIAGLMARAVMLPVEPANMTSLDVRGEHVFYQTKALPMIEGDLPGDKPTLRMFDLGERKDAMIVEDADNYSLSADGTKVMIGQKSIFHIIDAKPDQKADGRKLDLDGLRTRIDPRQEWAEIFDNAWRLERDLFYNASMNGVDWKAVHDSYGKLLKLVGSRDDLTYLMGQVQGELGNSHTYVTGGGGENTTESAPTPLLGADFAVDADGRTTFARILPSDNTREDYRSPLTEPGLGVKAGDTLLAINGHELKAPDTPFSLMAGVQGPVTLTVAAKADGPRRDIVVDPVKNELSLREKAFIDHNRDMVDRLSGGRNAYIYLSNMESLGMEQFVRQFYPQMGKQALIVDDRWNGGGFIDQIILERLRRTLVGMSTNRERYQQTIPGQLINGPKICLLNHYSASDGDIFPYYFRKYGLGPLLGTRSWGGVRGIRGSWTLLDGGSITVPEDSLYGLDSQWVIENHGVEPDMVVENEPGEFVAGRDHQLEAAVDYLKGKLASGATTLSAVPPLLPAYPPGTVPATHDD